MIEWITTIIKDMIKKRFTGSLRINFFNGGIANINLEESIKPPQPQNGG